MNEQVQTRKTYKYRMYRGSDTKRLHQVIDIAGLIWNHCIALQRRYYRLTGNYISAARLKAHVARLRMKTKHFAHWKLLGSQGAQDVVERLDAAYQKFFNGQGGRPSFQKVKKYRSFTLKQAAWKLMGGRKIEILGRKYKFVKHREIGGMIKTVTIKRDSLNRLWVCFSVIEEITIGGVSTGKIGGFDFGLKTFLTDDEGRPRMSPEYFKQALKAIRQCNRKLSKKEKGSRNRNRARRKLGMAHEHIANKRLDHHFKLAHQLCDEYDFMFFEDLNLRGMKALWGRKVSDVGFGQFLQILQYIASIRGKEVGLIGRFEPTTQTCSGCGHQQKIALRERTFVCQRCALVIARDHNSGINIKRVGISTLRLEVVRLSSESSLV